MYVYIPSKKGVRESPCAAEEKVCVNMESPGTLSLVCVDRSPQKSLQHSSIRIGSKRTPQKLHLPSIYSGFSQKKMLIFHSYVSLPEGTTKIHTCQRMVDRSAT